MTRYDDPGGVTLYGGDFEKEIATLPIEMVSVLITDPPYATYNYIREMEEGLQLDFSADMDWSGKTFYWIGCWLRPFRLRLSLDAVGWIFCNVHYVGFYIRWAYLLRWQLRGVFFLSNGEFLLALGRVPLTNQEADRVHAACQMNVYGQNKNIEMLRAIIQASPAGLVCDPFAGQASTLIAARAEGRPAFGVEIYEPTYHLAVAALQAEALDAG